MVFAELFGDIFADFRVFGQRAAEIIGIPFVQRARFGDIHHRLNGVNHGMRIFVINYSLFFRQII